MKIRRPAAAGGRRPLHARTGFRWTIAGLLIAALAYGYMQSRSAGDPSRVPGGPGNIDSTPGGDRQAESPRYQETLEDANDQRADEADQAGQSSVPTLEQVPQPVAPPPSPSPPPPAPLVETREVVVPPPNPSPAPAAPAPAPAQAAPSTQAAAMLAQMTALMAAWKPPQSEAVVLATEAQAPAAPAGTPGAEAPPAILIPAGQILYAQTITASDSDSPGPVLVEVVDGEFKGARLIGAFQVNDATDRLILQFTQMTLPDGKSLAVNAYAVDPVTAQTSVVSDVDRRWLERYGPLIAASFVTGFSEAVATAGSTVTVLTDSVTTTEGEPSTTESLFAGVARAGEAIANNIAASAPKGPLVMLESGYPVGLLFIAPVLEATR